MTQQEKRFSPIVGEDVPFTNRVAHGVFHQYDHTAFGIPDLCLGEEMALKSVRDNPYSNSKRIYTVRETDNAWNLIRSKLWSISGIEAKRISILTEHEFSLINQSPQAYPYAERFNLLIFEQQIEEAQDLTFLAKCFKTLENLYQMWQQTDKPVNVPNMRVSEQNTIAMKPGKSLNSGVAYGCDEQEAGFVYGYLLEQGFILAQHTLGFFLGLVLTPTGYIEVDRLRRGSNAAIKRAFFIRRYDTDLDAFMQPVMNEVQRRTGCEIKAVWETHHNERIDERILRLIREASLVVLDIDSSRFNVGFEAGYALALHKPIVTIREKPITWIQPPFDIATLNCFDYERSNPEQLINTVSERVLAALEEIKLT